MQALLDPRAQLVHINQISGVLPTASMVSNVDLFAHVVTFCEYQVVLTHPSPSYPHICMSSGLTLSLSLCLSVCLSSIYIYIWFIYFYTLD